MSKLKPLERMITRGTKVRIKLCTAPEHVLSEKTCVCGFIGQIVVIGNLHLTNIPTAPRTYNVNIHGQYKLVTRKEIVILRNQKVRLE